MRKLLWIAAAALAVGPFALVEMSNAGGAAQAGGTPVSHYVLTDGPVAASTDDVTAAISAGDVRGASDGSAVESLLWTLAAGGLVAALWGGIALGESRGEAKPLPRRRRWLQKGWFAVTGHARWSMPKMERTGG